MIEVEAPEVEVKKAEDSIRAAFDRSLDEMLRGRSDPRPLPSDDRAIFAFADKAVRDYHAATARSSLPRLSKLQYWELRQRLYITHSHLGPLGELLAVEGVEDIHIIGATGGYLELGHERQPLPVLFDSEEQLIDIVRYYAEQAGKHFDPANPLVTVTLRDGSRLNAILPPVSKPLVITVRKQQLRRFTSLRDLLHEGTIPESAIPFLDAAVRARLNAVISGPTGSGKTTFTRILALLIPDGERTCVLETETELWLHELREDDFFSLEERDANVEGAGRITLQDLFQRGALRQRPERIIVGEVRGGEAMDMLHAMSSGHDGSFSTIHASSARDALYRLEALALMGASDIGPYVVRHMMGSGIDLLIHLSAYRRSDGLVRRLASLAFVAENSEDPTGTPVVQQFCRYRPVDDTWEWDVSNLNLMPKAIAEKFLAAGIDPDSFASER